MRLRRRHTPDPSPAEGQEPDDLSHPIFDFAEGASDGLEPAADGDVAPGDDVPATAPDAPSEAVTAEVAPFAEATIGEVAEATIGEETATRADPTSAIPHDRVGEGAVPLHDPAPSGPLTLTPRAAALAAEACSKSSSVWVKPAGTEQFRLAWHVWHADAVHIVTGVGEQMLPPLAGEVEVAVRSKDTGGRLITFVAQGQEVPPSSADWGPAADALVAARLNAADQAEMRARWSGGATVYRLVPVAYLSLGPGDDETGPGNVRPPRIAATTVGEMPWHVGGRKRRIRGIWKRDGKGALRARDGAHS